MHSLSYGESSEAASLQWIVAVLRLRWFLLALPMIAAVVAAVVLTARTQPLYRSSAEVLIRTEESSNLFPLSDTGSLLRSPSAEAGFLGSTEYVDRALAEADSNNPAVVDVGDVNSRVEPSFVTFTAIEADATAAATTAQAWADTYISMRHDRDVDELTATLGTLENTRGGLEDKRREILSALNPIDRALQSTSEPAEIAQLTTQRIVLRESLAVELAPIESQIGSIDVEVAGLRLIQNFLPDSSLSARVNRVALIPEGPFAPSFPKNIGLALVIGLVAGSALLVLVEAMDDRVRSSDRLSAQLRIDLLATVPRVRGDRGEPTLKPQSQVAECFQRLASAVKFAGRDETAKKVLLFTSARPSESKTTTVARLGTTLAMQGRKTIVISADMRRPTLAARFCTSDGPGLAELVGGGRRFHDCIFHAEGNPNLHILRAGLVPDGRSPVEILRRPEMAELIAGLRERYDHILIDCPPVLPVVDALEVASLCDGVVLNVFARKSRVQHLEKALSLIHQATSTPVLGFVLTGVDRSSDYGGGYEYYQNAPSPKSKYRARPFAKPSGHAVSHEKGGRIEPAQDRRVVDLVETQRSRVDEVNFHEVFPFPSFPSATDDYATQERLVPPPIVQVSIPESIDARAVRATLAKQQLPTHTKGRIQ